MAKKTLAKGPWYRIQSRGSEAELLIFGDIGSNWFDDESNSAKEIVEQLNSIDASRITARINSYGGAVADGIAIYNALKRHPAEIVVSVEGVAVSIASLIVMAGDRVEMYANSLLMVHAPWGVTAGNAAEMREMAEVLDKYASSMASSYASKSGMSKDEVLALLSDGVDHWYSAEEAVEAGFADAVIDGEGALPAVASLKRFAPRMPLQIAAQFRGVPMKPNTTSAPSAMPKPALVSEDEVHAKLRERNETVQMRFKPFLNHGGVQEIYNAVLADPSLSAGQCSERLLAHLGSQASPLAGNPRIEVGDDSDYVAVASDAICLRAGIRLKNPLPQAKAMRRVSIAGIAESCLSLNDRNTSHLGHDGLIRAALSTSDFPETLRNAAEKSLLVGYTEEASASHRAWTREGFLNDFKLAYRVAMSEAPGLLTVPEGSEIKHGKFTEKGTNFKLVTYGRQLQITRESLINDDLDAFTRMPQAFGAAAARKECEVVYSLLTSNPVLGDGIALFHASHSNLMTAAALSVTSLGAARAAMRKQLGLQALAILNTPPRYLIVPAALETLAEQLIASLVDPSKSNDTPMPAWVRQLQLVVDARLDAASATAWYLAADPNSADTIEIAHLAGEETVQIETDTDWDTNGFKLKATLDFGAVILDFRGLVLNPGL
ncbi:MAG: ClpP-like prohead protease/major capsid protein fusion protein [Gammaproteobacteria bacterium]